MLTSYPGSKNGSGVVHRLINQIPPHRWRAELFLGSGALSRALLPAPAGAVGVEVDPAVVAAWEGHGIPGFTVVQLDALSWLHRNKDRLTEQDFVYLDPPYPYQVRRGKEPIYAYEFGEDYQHAILLTLLKRLRCMVMISGYWCALYAELLAGWRSTSYQANTHAGQAVEWVWMNYSEPEALHDYRYLGEGFRERERIRRRQRRWQKMLGGMPRLERLAMHAAIEADMLARAASARDGDAGHAVGGVGTR